MKALRDNRTRQKRGLPLLYYLFRFSILLYYIVLNITHFTTSKTQLSTSEIQKECINAVAVEFGRRISEPPSRWIFYKALELAKEPKDIDGWIRQLYYYPATLPQT